MSTKSIFFTGVSILLLSACGKNAHVTGVASPTPYIEQQSSGLTGELPANWVSSTQNLQQQPQQQQQGNLPAVLPVNPCVSNCAPVPPICLSCPPVIPPYVIFNTHRPSRDDDEEEVESLPKEEAKIDVHTIPVYVSDPPKKNENKYDEKPIIEVEPSPTAVVTQVPCGEESREIPASIRGLNAGEYDAATELPYLLGERSAPNGQLVNVTASALGEVDGTSVIEKDGTFATKDNHVVFGAELDLPPAEAIVRIDAIRFSMALTKFENRSEFGSELFCSLDLKRCSGKLVNDPKLWADRKNQAFFSADAEPVNDVLGKTVREDKMELVSKEPFKMKGLSGKLRKVAEQDFSLEELLAITDAKQFVEGAKDLGAGKRLLRFMTADDIYPVDPKLSISLTVDTCKIPK